MRNWTPEQILYLEQNYSSQKWEILKFNLQKSDDSIRQAASKFKLKRKLFHTTNKKCNVEFLLEDNLNSFYWVGYLLADGSFTSKGKNIKLTISETDLSHIEKFAALCNTTLRYGINKSGFSGDKKFVEVSSYDSLLVPQIMRKFDIKQKKTYNPPDFTKYIFTQEQITSMCVGFIDGDGCISSKYDGKYPRITIQNHGSWLANLVFMNTHLHTVFGVKQTNCVKLDERGYATLAISKKSLLKGIKTFIELNQLPIMNRKWQLISYS